MHIVFDKMIGHLLEDKPADPIDSLVAYMTAHQAELEKGEQPPGVVQLMPQPPAATVPRTDAPAAR
ncbi:hypothetical protein DIPPA_04826 [Diplonema papillatum]|nr:hypothetical protein DIPPA_04826 [Diplonema papillatum]